MRSGTSLFFVVTIAIVISACFSKKATTTAGKIIISSHAPVVPVLKGTSTNALIRLKIEVLAGSSTNFSELHGTLDANAIDALEKLEVYYSDTVPVFSDKKIIGSTTSLSPNFRIPISLSMTTGIHYLWLSGTLKASADVDRKIEVHVSRLEKDKGDAIRIVEDNSAYTRRIGIAVRKAGEDGVNTYRIPGITITDKGTLIAVYDIRYTTSRDLPGNIDVGMSRSTDSGKSWQPMKVIMDMGPPHENNGIGDPAILFDPVTKKLWVAALWSKGNRSIAGSKPGLSPDTTGQFVLVSSDDYGLTWSTPYSITNQVKNPAWHLYFNGPGNGIVMQNGTLVFPSQYWDENKVPHSSIIYSNDHGVTWKSGKGARSNTTESQVVETTTGTLMLSMRDNRGKFRSIATTTDMGNSWIEHQTSYNTLPDPVCMASIIKARTNLSSGAKEILFFSNPNSNVRPLRDSMTIKASLDLGESWQPANQLLIDERELYGYSVLVKVDENTLGLLYEGVRELYFVRVPIKEIIK